MDQHEVVRQVRTALEVLSAGGVSGGGGFSSACGGAGSTRTFLQEWQRANAILRSLVELPAAHNLALMVRVQDGNMKFLEGAFADLVSALWHGPDVKVQKYGRKAVEYLARRWLVGLGSYREFAEEFGVCSATASAFCRAYVSGELSAWLTAATGVLEPVCEQFADEVLSAA